MPIIPTVPQSDAPIQGPRVAGVSEEAFGGGLARSLGEFANTLERSGDKIFARAQALQRAQNDDESARLEADFIIKSSKLKEDFETLQGQDRVNAYSKYQKDMTGLAAQIRDQSSNPYVRTHMTGFLTRQAAYNISHGAAQSAAAQRQASAEAVSTNIEAVKANVASLGGNGDENVLEEGLAKQRQNVFRLAGLKGWSPEVAEQQYQRQAENLRAVFVDTVNATDPITAKRLLEKYAGQFGEHTKSVTNNVDQKNRDTVTRMVDTGINQDLYSPDPDIPTAKTLEQRVAEARKQTAELLPGDDKALEQVTQRVTAEYNRHHSAVRDTENQDYQSVAGAVGGWTTPGGRLPINIDQLNEMSTPEQRAAFQRLPDTKKNQIRAALAKNAKGDVLDTPERRSKYEELDGMSRDDPEKFLGQDLFGEDLTRAQRNKLFTRRDHLKNDPQKDPRIGHALSVLQSEMFSVGALKTQDESKYYKFVGVLGNLMAEKEAAEKKPMKFEDIKLMGNRILQSQITEPTFFGLGPNKQSPLINAGIPSDIRKQITSSFVDIHSRPPTEMEIGQMYMILKYNQLYKKSTPTAPASR